MKTSQNTATSRSKLDDDDKNTSNPIKSDEKDLPGMWRNLALLYIHSSVTLLFACVCVVEARWAADLAKAESEYKNRLLVVN